MCRVLTGICFRRKDWSDPQSRPSRIRGGRSGDRDAGIDKLAPHDRNADDFRRRAGEVYAAYSTQLAKRFRWLRAGLFVKSLSKDSLADSTALLVILKRSDDWDPGRDFKLKALLALLTKRHPNEKVLVFTQFADTVRCLESQLRASAVAKLEGATGNSPEPTGAAWRFSPVSSNKRDKIKPEDELRVVMATGVLSEGQNLQDCSIVVNYDLPWAIIRLVQRAGRVARIGQQADAIRCYSFVCFRQSCGSENMAPRPAVLFLVRWSERGVSAVDACDPADHLALTVLRYLDGPHHPSPKSDRYDVRHCKG